MQEAREIGDGRGLAEQAIDAHGGLERWRRDPEVAVKLSSGGFAFATKFQGHAVRDAVVRVATAGQQVTLDPFPDEGTRGVLDAAGNVAIVDGEGAPVRERRAARAAFGDLRHTFWWDRLDILYFATYAMWTYLSSPFVFCDEGYGLRELEPWSEAGETWRRLAVSFPASVQTHSREQIFYIDGSGLIRRHDYTAEPFGGWARAAHYSYEHTSFDGLIIPRRRLVYPRRPDNRPRGHPRLVWIEVSEPGAPHA